MVDEQNPLQDSGWAWKKARIIIILQKYNLWINSTKRVQSLRWFLNDIKRNYNPKIFTKQMVLAK